MTTGNESSRTEANPFELAKQSVLYKQKAKNIPLPHFGLDLYRFEDDYPDLVMWWEYAKVLPADILEAIDFSKPYDSDLINKYRAQKSIKKVEINADDFVNAELEDC